MPYIYASETHAVAVCSGEGKNNIPSETVLLYTLYNQTLDAIGVVVDTDEKQLDETLRDYMRVLTEEAQKSDVSFSVLPSASGEVTTETPRIGIYVLPGSGKTGALEDVLVDCASISYPLYKLRAEQFLDNLTLDVDNIHVRRLKNAAVKKKALVATIVSVLKPGRGNAPSISDDKWICEDTENAVPEIVMLKQFILDLLDLTIIHQV